MAWRWRRQEPQVAPGRRGRPRRWRCLRVRVEPQELAKSVGFLCGLVGVRRRQFVEWFVSERGSAPRPVLRGGVELGLGFVVWLRLALVAGQVGAGVSRLVPFRVRAGSSSRSWR